MFKSILLAATVLAGGLLIPSRVLAQGGLARPTVSPYLNLITTDQFGFAGGYQTLVRPFVDQRQAVNANSAAIQRLQAYGGGGVRGAGAGGGGSRGLSGRFMNYGHYYLPTR